MRTWLEKYLADLAGERRGAARTVLAYRADLEHFLAHWESLGIPVDPRIDVGGRGNVIDDEDASLPPLLSSSPAQSSTRNASTVRPACRMSARNVPAASSRC
jgi:site-specific recombinase XerD